MKQYIKKALWIIPFVFSLNLSAATYYFKTTVSSRSFNTKANWQTATGGTLPTGTMSNLASASPSHTFDLNGVSNVDLAGVTIGTADIINSSGSNVNLTNSGTCIISKTSNPFSTTNITCVFNSANSTFAFRQAASGFAIFPYTYLNLDIGSAAKEIAISSSITVQGTLTITTTFSVKGTLILGSGASIASSITGTIEYNSGATINDNRTGTLSYPLTFKHFSTNDVFPASYSNLYILENTKLTNQTTVTGTLTIGSDVSNALLNLNSQKLIVSNIVGVYDGGNDAFGRINPNSGTIQIIAADLISWDPEWIGTNTLNSPSSLTSLFNLEVHTSPKTTGSPHGIIFCDPNLTTLTSYTITNDLNIISGAVYINDGELIINKKIYVTSDEVDWLLTDPNSSSSTHYVNLTNANSELVIQSLQSTLSHEVGIFKNNSINKMTLDFSAGGTYSIPENFTISNELVLSAADNYLDINGTTLTLGGVITNTNGANGGHFIGNSSSNLICSTANVGTIYFDQSSTAASTLQNLTLANGASCTLGSNLILANGVDLGTSNLTVGSNTLTFAGSSATWITRNGGLINTTGGTIEYAQTSTTVTNYSIDLSAYYTSTAGVPINNFTLNFSNARTFTPPSNMTIGGTLNLSGTNNTFVLNGTTLTVSGSVTSTGGKFKGSSTSNLNCSGTSSLYFDQTDATTKTLKNLKIQGNNASVTLANALNITAGTNYGSVEVTAASSTLSTGNNLTLKSDASGTARIANSAGTISGRYYAELYFPAKREYRFISAPVVGATALQWRNNGSTSGSSTSGVGIHISGTNGATDSFDATTANKPSAFYYDEPSAGSVTNINSTGKDDPGWKEITKGGHYQLTNGKGYRVLIRGDRNISLTTSNPAANTTTITSYGSYPRTSASGVTLNVTNSNSTEMFNGLNLIGNPYPSAIDWNTITRTNVDNGYTVYNFNNGGYDAWNGSTGDAGRYISAGQAVFVWCNNSTTKTGSLTINESDKYDGKGGSYFLEKLTNHLKINLLYDSVYNSNTFLHFRPDALDTRDVYDIPQFLSNGTNVATLDQSGHAYKINSMLNLDSFTSIPLSVAQTPAAQLKLSFYDVPSFDGYKLELIDNYKKTKSELTEGFIYNFEITNDSFSQKNGRFYINFTRQPGMNNHIIQKAKIAEIYPNPIDTKINIKLDSKFTECSYVIYNSLGQQISKGTLDNKIEKSVNTKNYANGSYYIVLKSANASQTIQFIK